jgi:membrane protein implicated in regulation of membrane protease activity
MLGGFFPGDYAPWLQWMIFAVILAIGELVTPGIFLIWIAIAAAITGSVSWIFPALPAPAQMLLFAALCLVATYGGRRWYKANPVPSADPLLNDRAARLVGRTVTVVNAIEAGEGRVQLDDGTWTARGPDAPVGARLTVTAAEGTVLTVAWPAA